MWLKYIQANTRKLKLKDFWTPGTLVNKHRSHTCLCYLHLIQFLVHVQKMLHVRGTSDNVHFFNIHIFLYTYVYVFFLYLVQPICSLYYVWSCLPAFCLVYDFHSNHSQFCWHFCCCFDMFWHNNDTMCIYRARWQESMSVVSTAL